MNDPAYIIVRNGKSHEMKELVAGQVLADFDEEGRLLGVEILSDYLGIRCSGEIYVRRYGEKEPLPAPVGSKARKRKQ